MQITERTLTLEECRGELFEPHQEPCFWDVLDYESLVTQHIGRVIVLDLAGALEAQGGLNFLGHVNRLIERGERTVVINLAALTSVDSGGLGELVRSCVALHKLGGAMPLVNAPNHFHRFVAAIGFL
jgi:anti-anti-sigma factor